MRNLLFLSFLICFTGWLTNCQPQDAEPEIPFPVGCDGDPSGTYCQHFFVPQGETLSYPGGITITAVEGIEINGTIVVDPSTPGDVTLIAASGDIVLGGKIVVKDTPDSTNTNGRTQHGKSASQPRNGPAADGFTLTLDARGENGNIVLKREATLFSGRGQHAPDEIIASVSDYYAGAGGGNGGLIILNAPNGKVILPKANATLPSDELFVLGNGGRGARVTLEAALEVGESKTIDVVGGLGGNAGELIIDALDVEGIPTLNDLETHPDFIYGGEGGDGGYVLWQNAGVDQEYLLQTITLQGGDGGGGATLGGDGGFAYFYPAFSTTGETFVPVGEAVPDVRCYGGDGGDVLPSPLPLSQVKGGNGGEYVALGVLGPRGGFDQQGQLFRNGGDGGKALGQGGNGGNVQIGVRAYQATGGSGGQSEQSRTELPSLFGLAEIGYLSLAVGVAAGSGGDGYGACDGCPGGNGGNAGRATAIGGSGGNVLGEAIYSTGGDGGDVWGLFRGDPGNGGNGSPGGLAGNQPSGIILTNDPGEAGQGTTPGVAGTSLGDQLEPIEYEPTDGETCETEQKCEESDPPLADCSETGGSFSYHRTELRESEGLKIETTIIIQGNWVVQSDAFGCNGGGTDDSCWECSYNSETIYQWDDGRPPVKTRSPDSSSVSNCAGVTLLRSFCTDDGQLFTMNSPSSVTYDDPNYGTVTETFGGCYGSVPEPEFCCPTPPGDIPGYYVSQNGVCPE